MNLRKWVGVLGALLVAQGCGASVKPALKQAIDLKVSGLSMSDQTFDPPGVEEAPKLQANTWATYKLLDDEGRPSFMTYKVLREDAGMYWIETISETYYSRSVQLMHVSLGQRLAPSDISVDRLYQKVDDGSVQEIPSNLLSMMGNLYKPALAKLSISWADLPQEDVAVPAGTFQQAYKKRVTSEVVGFKDTSDVWYHDAAPVGGTVRSVSLDNGTSMELVEMGDNPEPEIPIP